MRLDGRRRRRAAALLLMLVAALAAPAGSGRWAGPARAAASVNLDAPVTGAVLLGDIAVSGWAADPAAESGTGVDRVQVYLDGTPREGGRLLGTADYGLARPDVGAQLGEARYAPSGFRLSWSVAAPPGPHQLVVLAHTTADDDWSEARVAVSVDPRAPRYSELTPPGDADDPTNSGAVADVLFDMQRAMAPLSSMREHRTGHLVTPEGEEQNLYLYNLEYQAPDRRRQQSTVTTPQDSAEQRIITIGDTSWFWRGGESWEESINRTTFAWPGTLYTFRPIVAARRLADDTLDGRAYRVVELVQPGSEWSGSPGLAYRIRLWVDAETSLPFKALKAATMNQIAGDEVVIYQYREETEFFGFNAPVSIEAPS